MQHQGERLALGQECIPAGEAAIIQAIEQISLTLLKTDYPGNIRPAKRDAHAKHHGCVKAEFIIENHLPEALKVGLFREPRTFPSWVRFSNGARESQADAKGDTRGIAIKLLGVEGEKVLEGEKHLQTHDFTLVNHPVFAIRNAQDYLDLFNLRSQGEKQIIWFFFNGPNPLKWRLHEFGITQAIQRKKIPNPLSIQYWSMVPYQFGTLAAKYTVKPTATSTVTVDRTAKHYLHEAMVQHLAQQPAVFDFLVQLQTDPVKMPIEDPTIAWDEKLSPYRKVATLKILPQSFDSVTQMQFCENLTYTPWHALPEHKPLGGINRVRRAVYESLSKLRHTLNDVPQEEPTVEAFEQQ